MVEGAFRHHEVGRQQVEGEVVGQRGGDGVVQGHRQMGPRVMGVPPASVPLGRVEGCFFYVFFELFHVALEFCSAILKPADNLKQICIG